MREMAFAMSGPECTDAEIAASAQWALAAVAEGRLAFDIKQLEFAVKQHEDHQRQHEAQMTLFAGQLPNTPEGELN